ncbi:cyclic AMP-dependent transcription factor ATF-6 alpha isoform X2 [Nilaparvata lugens]|uniref:cyclic AMP-dependent transcription factor ATF-6 alpha isoform X2 n=1 Tax=Nilaparvata lugens TaxID=108931 RepID=UPI00193EAA9E|nr:cyclic AMP-dependent transcription factor ATF-6 alpha isoform X2 [Nilaparvata lugens]
MMEHQYKTGNCLDNVILDLSYCLGDEFDMDCDIPTSEDFLHELSNDLQIPMLLEESNFKEECEISDSSSLLHKLNDWGNDSLELQFFKDEIKEEPKSPNSTSSIDSWQAIENDAKVTLETPPISPPETTNGSPPRSPTTETVHQKFAINEKPVILCNGSNGAIRILPYNNRNNCKKNFVTSNVSDVNVNGKKSQGKVVVAAPGTKIINLQRQVIGSNVTPPTITVPNDLSNTRRVLVSTKDISLLTQQNNRINSLSNINCISGSTANTVIPVITNPNVPAVKIEQTTSKLVPASVKREMQLRVLKRQQRMIKNRESACLSRKKKKEYVSSLETRISDLEKENLELRKENASLKERLCELEGGVSTKPKSTFQPNLKKTSVILAVLLVVSVNLGSISLMKRPAAELSLHEMSGGGNSGGLRHTSRTLLWQNDDIGDSASAIGANATYSSPLTCPLHINQTESLRLNSELRRWIGVEEDGFASNEEEKASSLEMNKMEQKLKELMLPPSPNLFTSHPQPPSNKSNLPSPKKKVRKQKKVLGQELQVLSGGGGHAGLLEAIRRRDDTFYVVSFSSDHLLLPAIAHNNTLRPKMSLILPAIPFNVSVNSEEPLMMMQIDCEVLDTRLVEVKEQDIPHHMRTTRHPSPTPPNVSDSVAVHQQAYRPYFMRASSDASQTRPFNSNENYPPVYKTRTRLRDFP